MASWYGDPYHGRRAANGEIYDMERLTAAHRTLPFGTRVRVDNLDNETSVEVRINDRGPFVDGRIIDVSRAAARALRMIGPGTARVRVEILEAPTAAGDFTVQVGAFRSRELAEQLRRRIEPRFGPARVAGREPLWRVYAGRGSEPEARRLMERLRQSGYEGWVIRADGPP